MKRNSTNKTYVNNQSEIQNTDINSLNSSIDNTDIDSIDTDLSQLNTDTSSF